MKAARFACVGARRLLTDRGHFLPYVGSRPQVTQAATRLFAPYFFSQSRPTLAAWNFFSTSRKDDRRSDSVWGGPFTSAITYKDPSQAPAYKASFAGGDPAIRQTFSDKTAVMPISIGFSLDQENGRLRATLELLAKSFDKVVILIDDLVQRHTLAISSDIPEHHLKDICLKEGDIWIKRYKDTIDEILGDKVRIVRWEDTLKNPPFQENKERVLRELATNEEYRDAFKETIDEVVLRFKKRKPALDTQRAHDLSMEYLIEECASMVAWPLLLGAKVEVYPARRSAAMAATNKFIIQKVYPDLPGGLQKVRLRFQKKRVTPVKGSMSNGWEGTLFTQPHDLKPAITFTDHAGMPDASGYAHAEECAVAGAVMEKPTFE